jgi:hypothetical protein
MKIYNQLKVREAKKRVMEIESQLSAIAANDDASYTLCNAVSSLKGAIKEMSLTIASESVYVEIKKADKQLTPIE